jgi:hypothetical protein
VSRTDDDWRLRNQGLYLTNATLIWREWTPPEPTEVHAWRMENGTIAESIRPVDEPPAGATEGVEPRGWDHDHCDFCWATFMASEAARDDPEILGAGYTVAGPERSTFWICRTCFDDFRERFGWSVVSDGIED